MEERIRKVFNLYDADGSGTLTLDEVSYGLRQYGGMVQEYGLFDLAIVDTHDDGEILKIFKAIDEDGNGEIDCDEFCRYMLKLFASGYQMDSCSKRNARISNFEFDLQGLNMNSNDDETLEDLDCMPSSTRDVFDWKVDYWSLSEKDDFCLVMQALTEWDCFSSCDVSKKTIHTFVNEARNAYESNPYHNWQHAMSTMHYSFKLVEAAGVTASLQKTDLFALIIGAIGHDLGHRGRNNIFEVATSSDLALRYSDDSPLERHHAALTFEIALGRRGSSKCNLFTKFSSGTYATVRRRITKAILATDMARHNDYVKALQSMTVLSDDAEFLVNVFMHQADIGNAMMPPEIAGRWSHAIIEEFTAQVKAERALGIPVTAMMDGLTDPVAAAKSQVGFIDFVVAPMAKPLFSLCPGMTAPMDNMAANREKQHEIVQKSQVDDIRHNMKSVANSAVQV